MGIFILQRIPWIAYVQTVQKKFGKCVPLFLSGPSSLIFMNSLARRQLCHCGIQMRLAKHTNETGETYKWDWQNIQMGLAKHTNGTGKTCAEKTIFPFTLNGIWLWWQFSFQLNQIEWNQIEFCLVQNRTENCYHDHIPFNVTGNQNIVFSAWAYI